MNGKGMDWKELLFNKISDMESKFEDRLDSIDVKQAEMTKDLKHQNDDLKYHIKRTNLLEAEIRPIKDHVNGIQYTSKVVTWIACIVITCGSIVGAITKIKGWW